MDEDNEEHKEEDSDIEEDTFVVNDVQEDEEVVNDVQDNKERDTPEDTYYVTEDDDENVEMELDYDEVS